MERRSLLISDVDGTLLGDDEATARFADWHQASEDRVRLVYTSGRFIDSVAHSVRSTRLPEPAAIIGGVGTQIQGGTAGPLLTSFSDTFVGWDHRRVRELLDVQPELELQPAHLQSEFKVSYYGWCLSADFL